MKWPEPPVGPSSLVQRSFGAWVSSASIPETVAPVVLARETSAEDAYGIIHQAPYQPPGAGSMPNISDRTSRSPSGAPKNSDTGESTVVRPSNVMRSRRPFRFASVAAPSGTRRRSPVIAAGPVRFARVAESPGPGETVAVVVVAPGCAGLGSARPASRNVFTTSVAGSAGSNRSTPSALANSRWLTW